VAQNVEVGASGSARFSASSEGTLVYRSGGGESTNRLVWVDRSGKEVGDIGNPGRYAEPALSPDGTELAVAMRPATGGNSSIWTIDLSRNLGSRFTFTATDANNPVWSPDGSRIVFSVDRSAFSDLYVKPFGGTGADSLVLRHEEADVPCSWAAGGEWLLHFTRSSERPHWDIEAFSMRDHRSMPVAASPFHEFQPALSPDGTLVAYGSLETGSSEVYVQAFPGPGGKWRVSNTSGGEPRWRGDGRELFYLGDDRRIMSVSVTPGSPPKFSLPQPLFTARVSPDQQTRNRYEVSKDGQRFLLIQTAGQAVVGPTTVVLDWLGMLEKR
jgi:eukaryotic-like serine/threonine-protein kinase